MAEATTSETTEETAKDDKSRLDRVREAVGDKYASASETVKKKYQAASEATKAKYADLREKVDELELDRTLDQVRTWVRENPGKAVLISVGVGFLIGLLLRRDDD